MMDLLRLAFYIFIGGSMIFFPEKILEYPACKIKLKGMIRFCGVVVIAVGFIYGLI